MYCFMGAVTLLMHTLQWCRWL